MHDPTDIINWAGVSRFLAGERTAISRNRCPKKYQPKVDKLIELIEQWQKTNFQNMHTGSKKQNRKEKP